MNLEETKVVQERLKDLRGKKIITRCGTEWEVLEVVTPNYYDTFLVCIRDTGNIHEDENTEATEMTVVNVHNDEFYPATQKIRAVFRKLDTKYRELDKSIQFLGDVWMKTLGHDR